MSTTFTLQVRDAALDPLTVTVHAGHELDDHLREQLAKRYATRSPRRYNTAYAAAHRALSTVHLTADGTITTTSPGATQDEWPVRGRLGDARPPRY